MAGIGYATLQVIPSLKGFSSKLRLGMGGALVKEGSAAGEATGKSFASSFAKVAAGAAVAVGAFRLGKGFVDAAVESQKVSKQTEAVLASMGNTAGLTAKDIGNLAEKQSMLSGVDDEVIQSAQNVLLTFGKVRNEVGKGNKIFDRGSQSALDMSVALGTDLQGATIQIGKALNDPIKGITALSRAGVSFTEQQKDQIKTLTQSGDVLGAQKVILSELENQFGGSAAAQATAGERLKVVIGNIQEEIGARLLPIVEKVASFLADKLPGAIDFLGRTLSPVIGFIGDFARAFQNAFVEGDTFGFSTKDGPIGYALVLGATIRKVVDEITGFFKRNWPTIRKVAVTAFEAIVAGGEKLATFVIGTLIPGLVKIGQWVVKNKPVLIGLAVAIGVGLVAAFTSWAIAAGTAAVATALAMAPVILIGAAIAALVAGIIYAYQEWDWFRKAVDAVARFLTDTLWPALQSIAGFIVDSLIPAIGDVITKLVEWGTKAGEIAADVIQFFTDVVTFVAGMPAAIATAATGLWNGILDAIEAVVGPILGFLDTILGPLDEIIAKVAQVEAIGKKTDDYKRGTKGATIDIGGFEIPIPSFPGLAAGGIVMPRKGGTFANIGEAGRPEAVVPLSVQGLKPFADALAPRIGMQGMAVDVSLSLDAPGAESAFKTWMLKAFRTDRGLGRVA